MQITFYGNLKKGAQNTDHFLNGTLLILANIKKVTFLIHYLFLISLLFSVKLTYSADLSRVYKINNIIVQTKY